MRRPLIIGHRGAPCIAPEHTETSYRAAFAAGVDLVEPDVVVSKDGVLVVRHEPELSSTTDVADRFEYRSRLTRKRYGRIAETGWFAEDFTLAELNTLNARERLPQLRPASAHYGDSAAGTTLSRILTLADLIELTSETAPEVGLVIELKHDARTRRIGHDYVDLIEQQLAGYWDAPAMREVRWESFELDLLERMRERDLPGKRILLVSPAPSDPHEEGPSRLTDSGLDGITHHDGVSVYISQLDADLVERAHARELEAMSYTVRPEDAFLPPSYRGRYDDYVRDLAATGVDALFCDDPGSAIAALAAKQ